MNNPKLKLDYDFYKIRGQTKAKLLDVEIVTSSELDTDMVALDVQYYVDVPLENDPDLTQKECRQIDIPTGIVTLLVFLGNKKIPFTVIRKCKEKKIVMYRKYADTKQVFDIAIK